MAKLSKGVKIKLDREREIWFTLRSIRDISEKYGDLNGLTSKIQQMSEPGGITVENLDAFIDLLFYGLRKDDPELSRDELYDMVDYNNLGEISNAMYAAFVGHMTDPKENTGE